MRLSPRGTGYSAIALGASLALAGIFVSTTSHPAAPPVRVASAGPTAYDDEGGPPQASVYTRIVTASADSTVDARLAGVNLGRAPTLRLSTSPARFAYLRFDVTGLTRAPAGARLWLHAADGSAPPRAGGLVASMAGAWTETGVTYDTRPGISGPLWARLGLVDPGNWYAVDVTPAVTGNGSVAFGLAPASPSTVEYDARENAEYAPRLELSTTPADPVLLAVGQIGACASSPAAALLGELGGTIADLGGLVDPTGCTALRPRTHPAAGAGERVTGPAWYSYELGTWHVVVLNSNCASVGGCGTGSPQGRWLHADLAAHASTCVLAYWSDPVFASVARGTGADTLPLLTALYYDGADVVLTGGSRTYERFAPLTPSGGPDPDGIREFVVGTGGAGHDHITTVHSGSEVRSDDTFGVLRLTLRAGAYEWRFVPEAGHTFLDQGTANCH
jgi:hypothetical protein